MTWRMFFLLVHVLIAIAAFGPTFAFPFISRFAQKDPRNALVVSEILHGIEARITIPAAVVMPFVGLALIYLGHFDLWRSEWLVIAIGLYIVTFFFSVFVQGRNALKMVNLMKSMPPPPAGMQPESGIAPVAGAGGPPPAVAALARKLSMGGAFVTIMLVAIIVLMVWKPGSAYV
jgi:predicted integral membrane protein DUF2269